MIHKIKKFGYTSFNYWIDHPLTRCSIKVPSLLRHKSAFTRSGTEILWKGSALRPSRIRLLVLVLLEELFSSSSSFSRKIVSPCEHFRRILSFFSLNEWLPVKISKCTFCWNPAKNGLFSSLMVTLKLCDSVITLYLIFIFTGFSQFSDSNSIFLFNILMHSWFTVYCPVFLAVVFRVNTFGPGFKNGRSVEVVKLKQCLK